MNDRNDMLRFVLDHYRHGMPDTGSALRRFLERVGLDRIARRRRLVRVAGIAAACSVLLATGLLLNNRRMNRWEETDASAVVLPDRTTVRLKEGSSLAFQPLRYKKERVVRLSGTGYFEVVPDRSLPFEVRSGDAYVRVLGTKFQFDTECREVSVGEGRVLFAAQGAEQGLEMPAGTHAVLAPGTGLPVFSAPSTPNPSAWATGRVIYDSVPLGTVLDELSSLFGTGLTVVSGPSVEPLLTAEFRLSGGLDAIITAIESALGVKIARS